MVTLVAFPVSSIGGLEPPLWWCCDMLACDKACLFFASSMEKKTSWVVQCWEATTQETNFSQYKYTLDSPLVIFDCTLDLLLFWESKLQKQWRESERKVKGKWKESERKVKGKWKDKSAVGQKRKRLLPCFYFVGRRTLSKSSLDISWWSIRHCKYSRDSSLHLWWTSLDSLRQLKYTWGMSR